MASGWELKPHECPVCGEICNCDAQEDEFCRHSCAEHDPNMWCDRDEEWEESLRAEAREELAIEERTRRSYAGPS